MEPQFQNGFFEVVYLYLNLVPTQIVAFQLRFRDLRPSVPVAHAH